MRIVAIIFGILAAIVDLILVIVSIAVPEVSLWGWIVVLAIVTVGLFFSANKVKKQKEPDRRHKWPETRRSWKKTRSAIAQGELPVVTGTPVLLEEGEVAHYYVPATKIATKNQGCRPNRKRCWRPCPRCEGRVGKHWRRFQSDGLWRSDGNLFRRYRFNE